MSGRPKVIQAVRLESIQSEGVCSRGWLQGWCGGHGGALHIGTLHVATFAATFAATLGGGIASALAFAASALALVSTLGAGLASALAFTASEGRGPLDVAAEVVAHACKLAFQVASGALQTVETAFQLAEQVATATRSLSTLALATLSAASGVASALALATLSAASGVASALALAAVTSALGVATLATVAGSLSALASSLVLDLNQVSFSSSGAIRNPHRTNNQESAVH